MIVDQSTDDIVLKAENISKYFYEPQPFLVLKNIGFTVRKG